MNLKQFEAARGYARKIGLRTKSWSDGPRCLVLAYESAGEWLSWGDYSTAIATLRSIEAKR